MLARIGRFDPALLYPIHHRSRGAHADLAVIRGSRYARALPLNPHYLPPRHLQDGWSQVALLHCRCLCSEGSGASPKDLLAAAIPCVNTIQELNGEIRQLDSHIEKLCAEAYPETKTLRQIAGVGPITALSYLPHP